MDPGYVSGGGVSIDWFFEALPGWKKFIGDGQNITKRNGRVPGHCCVACGTVLLPGLKLKRPKTAAAAAK